jgi:glucokinase-like ROK family protein
MRKATPERARTHNTQLVLRTIYDSGEISRADISRSTHLTRPTVSTVVSELMDRGLIQEVGYAPSSGGKRPLLLSVDNDSWHLIGLNLARESFCGAVLNLRGEIQYRTELTLDGRDTNVVLDLVYEVLDPLIERSSPPLLGIGIGAPGLVDTVHGIMREAVNLHWRDVPLRRLLQERYKLPVYMANDCQLAALAEYTFGKSGNGAGSRAQDLVVINVGWGVGAGIVLNGQLLHGHPLGAGEIGHVAVVEDGERCQCGNLGCLETVASTRAIVRRAQEISRSDADSLLHQFAPAPVDVTFDTVCQAFQAGDTAIQHVIRDVGKNLGIAAANLIGVLGSCHIVIAGRVTCFGQFLLDTIRAEMTKRCLLSLVQGSKIGFVSLGSDIVLLGASALLMSQELGLFAPAQRSRYPLGD